MFVYYGYNYFGKVDRVPGVCYVVTKFFHVYLFPLFPKETYVAIEGTETRDGFRGYRIPQCNRSIMCAYLRCWTLLIALLFGWFGFGTILGRMAEFPLDVVPVAARIPFLAMIVLYPAVFFLRGRWQVMMQCVILGMTFFGFYQYITLGPAKAMMGGEKGLFGALADLSIANVALACHVLLRRRCTLASPERRNELLDMLAGRGDAEFAPDPGTQPNGSAQPWHRGAIHVKQDS